ncbi:MAG: 2-oxo acid dehydrogenase subunit E2 [Deltaproteobacteria bacterium]|nr:2-oxo acid dehydrogenase subunit E2 [Deltaproteobacteria bacterium]
MATTVTMPKLGLTMKQGKVVKWLKAEGDSVAGGEILYEVETDKITNKIESPASGVLFQIVVPKGTTVAVGAVVGIIAEPGEQLERVAGPTAGAGVPKTEAAIGAVAAPGGGPAEERKAGPSSPAARRLAKELGVELARVPGTGPGGRVTEEDVRRFHEEGPPPPRATPLAAAMAREYGVDLAAVAGTGDAGRITRDDVLRALVRAGPGAQGAEAIAGERPVQRVPFEGMRRAIADNMHASLQNAAQLTLHTEVDVTEILRVLAELREEHKGDESVRLALTPFLVMAAARALQRFPRMNSTQEGEEILVHEAVHMGIAVALPEGLIVPVLRDADRKGILQLAREAQDLAQKAREGLLTPDEASGGTFTITNLSRSVVDGFTPILRPPETGILGVGRVVEKPAVVRGEVAVRSVLTLSLTFDHRIVDGAPAAEFLGALCRCLERPGTMLA